MAAKSLKHPPALQALSPLQWAVLILLTTLVVAEILIAGGDLLWWQAWVVTIWLLMVSLGGRVWAEIRHPGLLAERAAYEDSQNVKSWDKLLSPLMVLTVTILPYLISGLDHRFGWSPAIPVELTILGLGLTFLGYGISAWALLENRFFSRVVRIQVERNHVVCDTGPYRFIRHPGYAGNLLGLVGLALGLASLWTLLPAVLALVVTLVRTSLEDQALQNELPGYREYARRTRFRLFPGIY